MLAPEYVTGLAEACGSFTYSRTPGNVTVYFALRLPERDRAILEGLQDFFRAGRIFPASGGLYFRVSRHNELPRVVEHFDRYPLEGHKRLAFAIWREMVALKSRFRRPDLERLHGLAGRLSSLTASRGRRAKP